MCRIDALFVHIIALVSYVLSVYLCGTQVNPYLSTIMLEQDIQKAIMDVLRLHGFKVIKFNNVGVYKKKTDSYIPTHQKGVSDLLCCAPDGHFVAIEVKRPGNKPTANQEQFLEEVREKNGIALVMTSVDDAIAFVEAYR